MRGLGLVKLKGLQPELSGPCSQEVSSNSLVPCHETGVGKTQWMAAQAVGHYYDLFVIRKHGLVQGHDSLRGVRTPTCESGASVPGSEKKTLAHLVLCSTRHMGTTIVSKCME